MLDHLTADDFECHAGQSFTITLAGGEPYPLLLVQVNRWGSASPDPPSRAPFTLLFHNDRQDAYLPQQIYRLEHPEMGALDLFLVPLGPGPGGMRYEAVFS